MKLWPFNKKLVMSLVTTNPETGEQNAKKFVRFVERQAVQYRVIILSIDNQLSPWPWMANESWRYRVIELLAEVKVTNAGFLPPNSMSTWIFTCHSDMDTPRIAGLKLTDSFLGE